MLICHKTQTKKQTCFLSLTYNIYKMGRKWVYRRFLVGCGSRIFSNQNSVALCSFHLDFSPAFQLCPSCLTSRKYWHGNVNYLLEVSWPSLAYCLLSSIIRVRSSWQYPVSIQNSCWSSNLCSSIWGDPQEYIAYESVISFPNVSSMSGLSNFDGFYDEW